MREIIQVACETPGESLNRFTSYQHLIWAAEANKGTSGQSMSSIVANYYRRTIADPCPMPLAVAKLCLGSFVTARRKSNQLKLFVTGTNLVLGDYRTFRTLDTDSIIRHYAKMVFYTLIRLSTITEPRLVTGTEIPCLL